MAFFPCYPLNEPAERSQNRSRFTSEVTKHSYEVPSKSSQTVATATFYFCLEDFNEGPFGELIRSSGTPPCNFGFSTKYRDSETGLNYYGYRYYSSGLGRWLGRDPIGEDGGLNLYGMVKNDSVNWTDVNGNGPFKDYWVGALWDNKVFFIKWLLGISPRKLTYSKNSSGRDKRLWNSLKQSTGYKNIKNDYSSNFCPENGNGLYGHFSSYFENYKVFIFKFNAANFQVGGFYWEAKSTGKSNESGKEKITFTIYNTANIGSLSGWNTFADIIRMPWLKSSDPNGFGGFAKPIDQEFTYEEEICCGEKF